MRVEASGSVPCDRMLVAEAPGHDEQFNYRAYGFDEPTPLIGKAGQQLWSDMVRFTGLGRDDFYVTNLIKSGLPNNRDPKPREISEALPEFYDEVDRVKPKVVVTAGAFATKAVLGSLSMALVHGLPHRASIAGHEFICHPIYHPAAGLHNKGFLAAFAYDLQRLGKVEPWEPSRQGAPVRWAEVPPECPRKVSHVAVDTEGWAEKPWGLNFSFDGKTAYVIPARNKKVLGWFSAWLVGKRVVGHNLLHDIPVLRALGVDLTGAPCHDTQVLAYHDMMRTGSGLLEAEAQNLGTLAYRELGLVLNELQSCVGVDFSTQTIPYTDEVLQYAGMDAIATWRLFEVYRRRGLVETEAYQIDMGQVPLVESMIRHGLPVDDDRATDFYMSIVEERSAVKAALRTEAASYGNHDFNPGSHPQVRAILQRIGLRVRKRTKGGLASTSTKALVEHVNEDFVKLLQRYRQLDKLKGTYLEPLFEEIQ